MGIKFIPSEDEPKWIHIGRSVPVEEDDMNDKKATLVNLEVTSVHKLEPPDMREDMSDKIDIDWLLNIWDHRRTEGIVSREEEEPIYSLSLSELNLLLAALRQQQAENEELQQSFEDWRKLDDMHRATESKLRAEIEELRANRDKLLAIMTANEIIEGLKDER